MFKSRISVSIDRSRDVFDYVTAPAKAAQWQSTCQGAQWVSEAPHGVGSTHNSVDKWLGRKIESTFEVSIWDRPYRYGFKVIEGPVPAQTVIGLESAGESGTEMTVDVANAA